ncbi:acyl-CoA dehydrogenase family protein [Conexibacter sp. SYSU D00693]|uniref:acyl-CoA dehydrogenase family protein n=1 Tax=Conexibacter sp. SYSU D00693 TaxID=2812560 RepID=UPI00196BA4B5|nr:acyl-CoA dehydrogenase family protein [Conexibacter sp. SYSU D00693]
MPSSATAAASFTKALALGEIHEELVFPYPLADEAEAQKVRRLISDFREYAAANVDSRRIDETGTIEDQVFRDLGDIGVMGLYVDERYGGQGLSQTGYARVFEAIGQVDGSLTIALGVHQSIGLKAIHLVGTDEQKERFLPDLATGRKLAGFALTEPNAGSDAYDIETRAVQQPDGSWLLNGEKRWIGNGCRGDVLTVFARCELPDGKDSHIALLVEKGMEGFDQTGPRYETMGLKGNHLCPVRFNDVRVPPENVLGEPGDGFRIAMQVLNNGRIGLGTGSVGLAKRLLDLSIDHVTTRRQFGKAIGDFDMVEDKIGWMVSHLFALESMAYLTTGLIDQGIEDYSVESAICKVVGTEYVWYQANRSLQLAGGLGYMRDQPYEQILRDIRIFPIFEGANDVLRSYIALTALKPLGEELSDLGDLHLTDPIGTLGSLGSYALGRVRREVMPDSITRAHPELGDLASKVGDQVKHLRGAGEGLLRRHGRAIVDQGMSHKRYSEALSDVLAQVAVLSRVTSIFEDQGVEASGQERFIAETFCRRAAGRVEATLDRLERNDDARMHSIARLAYKRGAYGYALFED